MTVVLDANVLFPQYLCDLLLSLADAELYRPIWSDLIHEEWMRNVIEKNPAIDPDRIERRRNMMDHAFPDACVPITDAQIEAIDDVHIKDRHVMAVAKAVHADGSSRSIKRISRRQLNAGTVSESCFPTILSAVTSIGMKPKPLIFSVDSERN